VVPKRAVAQQLDEGRARALIADGGLRLVRMDGERVLLVAIGAYQLAEVLRASEELRRAGVAHGVTYLAEPGRFRAPRDAREAAVMAPADLRAALLPAQLPTVVLSHTHAEPMLGLLAGARRTSAPLRVLGYRNQGGTLDAAGMLRANQASAADVLAEVRALSELNI
jgi:phosphoketolase